jgi:hypothetical protein
MPKLRPTAKRRARVIACLAPNLPESSCFAFWTTDPLSEPDLSRTSGVTFTITVGKRIGQITSGVDFVHDGPSSPSRRAFDDLWYLWQHLRRCYRNGLTMAHELQHVIQRAVPVRLGVNSLFGISANSYREFNLSGLISLSKRCKDRR